VAFADLVRPRCGPQDPSTRIRELMDRALGKPVASVDVKQSRSMDFRWRDDLVTRLEAGRKRVALLDAERLQALKR
jgi:hypothetical protein